MTSLSVVTNQGSVADLKLIPTGDGKFAIAVSDQGSGSGSDRELVVSTYLCKTAFTGASVGDTITATQVIDVSGATPSTVSTIWRNQTTATDLASAPSAADLELLGSEALTDAQLRAAPLEILAGGEDAAKDSTAVRIEVELQGANFMLTEIKDKLPSFSAPVAWDGLSFNALSYPTVVIVVTTAPTTAYTIEWSPDQTNWYEVSGVTLQLAVVNDIAIGFTGAINVQGGGYVRLTGGAGGVFQIGGAA